MQGVMDDLVRQRATVLRAQYDLPTRDFRRPVPAFPLNHYTTMAGLLGILRTGRMWATHTQFLNDPDELAYSMSILKYCLEVAANRTYYPELKSFLLTLAPKIEALSSASSHVTCFTELADSLVLWNTYTHEATGVAIECNPLLLAKFAEHTCFLTPICYEPSEQIATLQHHVDSWLTMVTDAVESGTGRLDLLINGEALPELISRLCHVLPSVKAPAYAHEREWRIITYSPDHSNLLFRASGSVITPYVELDLHLPIDRIIIGPNCPDPIRTKLAIEMVLAQKAYSQCFVNVSQIPYRHAAKR